MAIEKQDDGLDTNSSTPKRMPPAYAVLREGTTSPEVFHAPTDEEALQRIQKFVRVGECKAVYLYKLFAAELFVASSVCKTGAALDVILGNSQSPQDTGK